MKTLGCQDKCCSIVARRRKVVTTEAMNLPEGKGDIQRNKYLGISQANDGETGRAATAKYLQVRVRQVLRSQSASGKKG